MVTITNKISVSEEIFYDEYNYMYGNKKDEKVNFTYVHKNGRRKTKEKLFDFRNSLHLAEMRARDGRYRNFTFEIN